MVALDPRLTPARPDLAARHLEGRVTAERFVAGRLMRVAEPSLALRRARDLGAGLETELLFGETFTLYEDREGWGWGQAVLDDYVGYVPSSGLVPDDGARPSHVVSASRTLVFSAPTVKSLPLATLSMGALLRALSNDGSFLALTEGGFVPLAHVRAAGARVDDWVAMAEALLGAPYLWGGRTSAGLDCSAVIQLALASAGIFAPRDSDLQQAALGRLVAEGTTGVRLQRGDLIFWPDHVGVMEDEARLIHANAFHMAVVSELLSQAEARTQALLGSQITAIRRL